MQDIYSGWREFFSSCFRCDTDAQGEREGEVCPCSPVQLVQLGKFFVALPGNVIGVTLCGFFRSGNKIRIQVKAKLELRS